MMMGSTRKDNVKNDPHPPGIAERDNAALVAQGKDTTKLHLIVDMNRCGAQLFNVKMEYTHFAPRSGKNYLFEMVIMKWPVMQDGSTPFMWAICSFPIEYRPQAESLAKECGLRIADGVPTVFGEKTEHFPLEGPTVFTLENVTGHQVYKNDPVNTKRLREEEYAACDKIVNADRAKLRQEMKDRGYLDDQITRILARWENGDESYDETPAAANDGQHRHKSPK